MPNYRCQVAFPFFTTLPSDVWTNTFHFFTLTPTAIADVANDVTPLIRNFYQNIYAAGRSMANYCLPSIAQAHWYDLADPQPRAPFTLPLGATIPVTATNVPTEVAMTLSFQGAVLSGTPQSRRRGRIYLGGLSNTWLSDSNTGAFPSFVSGTRSAVTAQAALLRTAVLAEGVRWAVWSTVDQQMTEITNGWVDNAPDTQRRRSIEPLSRTLWP